MSPAIWEPWEMVKEVHRSLVLSPALLEKPSHLWCAACSWQVDSLHGGHADPHKGNRGAKPVPGRPVVQREYHLPSSYWTGRSAFQPCAGEVWLYPAWRCWILPQLMSWHLIWVMCMQLRKHPGSIHVRPFRHNTSLCSLDQPLPIFSSSLQPVP